MIKLSIVMSAIRPHQWERVYNAIKATTKHTFEIIFIGPCNLPASLEGYKNIKCIRDFGSTTRATQMGLLIAEGDIVVCTADDGIFLPGAIDEAIDFIGTEDYKRVTTGLYYEGRDGFPKDVQQLSYFRLNNAYPRSKFASDDWWVFNIAFLTRKFLLELGGIDCRFEHVACAFADLAIRSYKAGATVKLQDNYVCNFDHDQPDHKPIELGQNLNDMPLYTWLHNDDQFKDRINIDIDNWRLAEKVWSRRWS